MLTQQLNQTAAQKQLKDKIPFLSEKSTTDDNRFEFICDGGGTGTFVVEEFRGMEHIARLYRFELTLSSSDKNVKTDEMPGKKASFMLQQGELFSPYAGIITSFEYFDTTADHSLYRAVIEPTLSPLRLNNNYRIFKKKTIPDIVKLVLKDNGIDKVEYILLNSYAERDYVVQYDESDFDFISRLMEAAGIWYVFKNIPLPVKLAGLKHIDELLFITDSSLSFIPLLPEPNIPFRRFSGLYCKDNKMNRHIYELEIEQTMIPMTVMVKNYNYRTPEMELLAVQPIIPGDIGTWYEYGGDFRTTSEAIVYARKEANRLSKNKIRINGKSFSRMLHAGCRIVVDPNDNKHVFGTMLIESVCHEGKREKGRINYRNNFVALPESAAVLYAPDITISAERAAGVDAAFIDSRSDECATLDDKGRYVMKMPFDTEEQKEMEGSKYLRMAQPYSGAEYGVHFPLHKDTEALIGYITGNPDKPFGLGSIPNANTISPVTSSNKQHSVIRTRAENEIVLDDTSQKERLIFTSPKDLSLSADGDQNIDIDNDRTVSVSNNASITIKGDQRSTVKKDRKETDGGDADETVKGDFTGKVEGDLKTAYEGTFDGTIDGDTNEAFTGERNSICSGNNTETYSSDYERVTVGDAVETSVNVIEIGATGEMSITAGKSLPFTDDTCTFNGKLVSIEGTASVTLQVGTTKIALTPAGIDISSTGKIAMESKMMSTTGAIIMLSGQNVSIN